MARPMLHPLKEMEPVGILGEHLQPLHATDRFQHNAGLRSCTEVVDRMDRQWARRVSSRYRQVELVEFGQDPGQTGRRQAKPGRGILPQLDPGEPGKRPACPVDRNHIVGEHIIASGKKCSRQCRFPRPAVPDRQQAVLPDLDTVGVKHQIVPLEQQRTEP